MTVHRPIALDAKKLNDALARFPRVRAMQIGGREAYGGGETIERRSLAHGVQAVLEPAGFLVELRASRVGSRSAVSGSGAGPFPAGATCRKGIQ